MSDEELQVARSEELPPLCWTIEALILSIHLDILRERKRIEECQKEAASDEITA